MRKIGNMKLKCEISQALNSCISCFFKQGVVLFQKIVAAIATRNGFYYITRIEKSLGFYQTMN